MEEQTAGRWFRSDTRFGPLFHAHLFAGQENSGKLVTLVKQQARLRALDTEAEWLTCWGSSDKTPTSWGVQALQIATSLIKRAPST